ncbi:MAG: glycosyl hydrolase family protein [Alphaproteobacteria bacterium]|nr:MAG: glycosyl hydrolase family protein [Alphaproteobacteria bacterium]
MHDYGMLWTPDAISFYVDRKMTATIDGAPFRDEVPVYMIANLAVGGSWGGNPDASTHFPAAMRIEHIKAYRLA